MTDLAELLGRVKAATGPDRVIDRWLQLLLVNEGRTGRFRSKEAWIEACRSQRWATEHFTRSIDAALALTDRVFPSLVINSVKLGDGSGNWQVREAWTDEAEVVSEWSPLEPRPGALAIVEVLLSALIAQAKP